MYKNTLRAITAISLVFALSYPIDSAFSEEISGSELQQLSFRIIKNSNGWFRVLKSGTLAAMTARDIYALGLDHEDAIGEFTRTVAVDVKNDTVQLVSDLGILGSYVSSDVAEPLISSGYEFTRYTAIPVISSSVSDAYEASKPVVRDAYEYTKDTIAPAAGELAVASGKALAGGVKSVWKWAVE